MTTQGELILTGTEDRLALSLEVNGFLWKHLNPKPYSVVLGTVYSCGWLTVVFLGYLHIRQFLVSDLYFPTHQHRILCGIAAKVGVIVLAT